MGTLLEINLVIAGVQYHLYGDPEYMLHPWLQVAFPREVASLEQMTYNKDMSSVREALE